MHLDTIELKWSYSENITNQNTEWFELVGYKSTTESLADFLETHKDYYYTLCYFINGKDLAQEINDNSEESTIEVIGHYFNRLSFNLLETSLWYDKDYKWERIILKRLLGYPISITEATSVYHYLNPTNIELETFLQEEILDSIMIYGCGCKDVYCGGIGVTVMVQDDTVGWDIQGFRKYAFDKKQYFQAFQEILCYIESKTSCFQVI
jgi:hypothetical protein